MANTKVLSELNASDFDAVFYPGGHAPLNRVTLSASYYDDHSYFLGMSSNYSLANDWQLLTVIQSFNGSNGSLFGEVPATLLFANVKYSF